MAPQRLPVDAGAVCCCPCCCPCVACCCAGFAGAEVTLRCVPTLLPPPRRRASASVATMAPPSKKIPIANSHLLITRYLRTDNAIKNERRDGRRPLRQRG